MPVNHTLEVTLNKGGGSNQATKSRTSPLSTLQNINKKSTFESYYDKLDSAIDSGGDTLKIGNLGSKALQGAKIASQFVDAGLNVLFDIEYAMSNEKIEFNNKKKIKNYIFKPTQFIMDSTYGKWLADLSIRRENTENERARYLSGNVIIGRQFGDKR